jgi:hypothetical protein
MAFLESYMSSASDQSKLEAGMPIDAASVVPMHLTGPTVPYSGNGIDTAALELSGNLAVYLGSRGVALQELRLTNPNLFAAPNPSVSMGTSRNLILEGNDWSNIQFPVAHGVVTSVNTPVASIGGSNLWYVVNGSASTNNTQISGSNISLEVTDATAASHLIPYGLSLSLDAMISSSTSVRDTLLSHNFVPTSGKNYVLPSRPTTTWESYAEAVRDGTTLPTL